MVYAYYHIYIVMSTILCDIVSANLLKQVYEKRRRSGAWNNIWIVTSWILDRVVGRVAQQCCIALPSPHACLCHSSGITPRAQERKDLIDSIRHIAYGASAAQLSSTITSSGIDNLLTYLRNARRPKAGAPSIRSAIIVYASHNLSKVLVNYATS